jgi:hypothetical protein
MHDPVTRGGLADCRLLVSWDLLRVEVPVGDGRRDASVHAFMHVQVHVRVQVAG